MKKISIAALVFLTLAMGRDAFTGTWNATLTPDDNGKDVADTLTFKGVTFTSERLAKDGFESARFEDDPSPLGVAAKFTAKQKNAAGDSATWTGTVVGGEMTGQLAVTKKSGDKSTYTFKAAKK